MVAWFLYGCIVLLSGLSQSLRTHQQKVVARRGGEHFEDSMQRGGGLEHSDIRSIDTV